MTTELYEESYKDPRHFSFGKNWLNFLSHLNPERIENAALSLSSFLNEADLKGKTFIDVGCGSGLFSLAAFKLGAKKIVSVDVDDFSISCAQHLRKQAGAPNNWEIKKGSALDKDFLNSLGTYDIVYSWGVLHHTGDMYSALENTSHLIEPNGKIYIAIYNDNQNFLEGSSKFWVKAKKLYNQSHPFVKSLIEGVYTIYYVLGLILNGKNPYTYIKNYESLRGMNFRTDIKDWLGGYPYEYASIEQIVSFYDKHGFSCIKKTSARSIGCNEFLFSSRKPKVQ